MHKRLALFLVLLLCLELTACTPAMDVNPTSSARSSTEFPTETPDEGVIIEPSHGGVNIDPPSIIEVGDGPMIIAEVLETTSESEEWWGIEYTKVNCRLEYGYKPQNYRYKDKVSIQGEFSLYLTADALQQLGQAEMLLLYSPISKENYGYVANSVIPITDGRIVLEGEWWRNNEIRGLYIISDHVQELVDKRSRGEEMTETEQLAPVSLLKNGMTVEEVIAFFDIWGIYVDQVSADFYTHKAQLES